MNNYELIFKIIEIFLQVILVVFAWLALSAWKKELQGKDKYKLAKELLKYIKEIRFLVHTKTGSVHQIYLNDIFTEKEKFYKDRLSLIGPEPTYFDQSIFGLFSHVNTRSNMLLTKTINSIIEDLYPNTGIKISTSEQQRTYIQLIGIEPVDIANIDSDNTSTHSSDNNSMKGLYKINNVQLTIEEYFKKWERLIIELQKIV